MAKQSSLKGKPKTPFSWDDEVELYTLEVAARQEAVEAAASESSAKAGYISLDSSRSSPVLEAWANDLAARSVTEKSIWDEFVVPEVAKPDPSSSPEADPEAFSIVLRGPNVWKWYLVVPVSLEHVHLAVRHVALTLRTIFVV